MAAVEWRHRGACVGEDPELFYPMGTGTAAAQQTMGAKAVCARCPVMAECLQWALSTGEDHGIWGGMSEYERRALRAQSTMPAPKPPEYCRGAVPHLRTDSNTATHGSGGKRCLDCEAATEARKRGKPRAPRVRRRPVVAAG